MNILHIDNKQVFIFRSFTTTIITKMFPQVIIGTMLLVNRNTTIPKVRNDNKGIFKKKNNNNNNKNNNDSIMNKQKQPFYLE